MKDATINIYAHEKIMHSLWIHLVSGTIDQRSYTIAKNIVNKMTTTENGERPYCNDDE